MNWLYVIFNPKIYRLISQVKVITEMSLKCGLFDIAPEKEILVLIYQYKYL